MNNIIGFYKQWALVELRGVFYVVNKQKQTVIFEGDEETANKTFIMLVANFINENLKVEA